jgi:hypothetical protein
VAKDHAARVRTDSTIYVHDPEDSRILPMPAAPAGSANQVRKNRWVDYRRACRHRSSPFKTGGEKARVRRDRTPSVAVRTRALTCRPRSLLLDGGLLVCHRDASQAI